MDVNEAFAARRSVRQFSPEPVERAILERLVSAATLAPSSRNEQPWEFYIATGVKRLEAGRVVAQTTAYLREYIDSVGPEGFEKAMTWYSSLGNAPALIALTSLDSDDEFTSVNRMLSIGAALENLLLAATAEGLGACPFTFSYWVKAELGKTLGLPEGRSIACVVALGWPASDELVARTARRSDVAVWLD